MADPIQQQVITYGLPGEVAPYAQDLLGRAQAMTDWTQYPYQVYQGERIAQFSPLQQQAFAGAQAMEAAPQLADASALAGTAGLRALQAGTYGPMYYTPQSFTQQGVMGGYMSPYMQGVVDVQQREAQRQADIQKQVLGAQFAKAGAFGGGRYGIQQAQAAADLARQKANIQATGLQAAYQQAQQQFNQEQAQRQAAVQLAEQSRQYGAGLGLQGLQTAMGAAGQLGQLGGTQFGQNLAINQLQQQYGQQQQQQMQADLTNKYQDFLNYQNFPYKQMAFMSDIIRGVPLTQTGTALYQAPPTTMQNLTSLGLTAAGLGKLFAEGGHVKNEKGAGLGALALSTI